MRKLFLFALLILPGLAFAQYPNNPSKIRLGFQTTAAGLVYNSDGPPTYTPSTYFKDTWLAFDTVANVLYYYDENDTSWHDLLEGNTADSVYLLSAVSDTSFLTPGQGDIFTLATYDTLGGYNGAYWQLFFGGGSVEQADGLTILGDGTGGDPFRVNTDSLNSVYVDLDLGAGLAYLPDCATSGIFTFSGIVRDPSIRSGYDLVGDLLEIGTLGTITFIQEEDGYANFEVSTSILTSGATSTAYTAQIEYLGDVLFDGIFTVVRGVNDTVTVLDPPGQDSIWATRVCGVEISRDTIPSKVIRDISDSTFLSKMPHESEIVAMFLDDDKATYVYHQPIQLNDRRTALRDNHRYNSTPSLIKTKKGNLIVAYHDAAGHVTDGDVAILTSKNGINWEYQRIYENDDPDDVGYYESVLATFNTDTIHLYTRWEIGDVGVIDSILTIHSISVDEGASWTLTDTLPNLYTAQFFGPAKGVEYNGRWLIPIYGRSENPFEATKAGVAYSDDRGATWNLSEYLSDTTTVLNESEIVIVGDTIIAMIRGAAAEKLYRTHSTDAGSTWSTPELATIDDWRRCHPGIIMLPNGNMLLNGRRLSSPTRRPTLWQSPDNGRNWETIGEIDSIGYSNYGSFAMLNNNKVGLVYSVDNRYDGTANSESALKFAVFDTPGSVVFERSGNTIEKVTEESVMFDDPVRNEKLWTSTRHYFDENVTVTVCKDSCDYTTINQAFFWAQTQIAAFDSTIASPRITIQLSRNGDGTPFSFSNGLYIPSGDWYPITITSNGDSVLYTGTSFAFRQYSRGMSPYFVDIHLIDTGSGSNGIQLIGANSYLNELVIEGFSTGVYLSEGNHFLYRSTIKDCGTGLFMSRGYFYIRNDSIYDCTLGAQTQAGFVEFRDMRIINNTTSVQGLMGTIFSYNSGTQEFWSNGSSPSNSDLTFGPNGGAIYRNFPESVGGSPIPCNTWDNGNYRGCPGGGFNTTWADSLVTQLEVIEDSTSITVDMNFYHNKVTRIDMTGVSNVGTITLQAPLNPFGSATEVGVYTFHIINANDHDFDFPSNFLDMGGAAYDAGSTIAVASYLTFTAYYDGTNYYCQ